MNKDVIYIDVEDDITAIIRKVKASKEKIIALVPPKRVGVLQSAVNLRLLDKAAKQADKRLVLITNNQALTALAANAQIPVAKNLQSKPELAEVAALKVDDDDDVIDGSQLPVSDHEKMADAPTSDTAKEDAKVAPLIATVDLDDEKDDTAELTDKKADKAKKGNKIPNFNTFRKKLFIGLTLLIALGGFLVWALVFAPRATVIITAHTTEVPVNGVVRLSGETSVADGTLKTETKTEKDTASIEFTATGEKDVGEKATGMVRFTTNSIGNLGLTISAGTPIESTSGVVFYTDEAMTFTLGNYTGADVDVTAAESGEKYNSANGTASGAPSGVNVSFVGPTSGGTTKKVKVVTASDVQKAGEQLVERSTDETQKKLVEQFGAEYVVIEDSFTADRKQAVSSPAVGEEASEGKATLKSDVTYSVKGVKKTEIESYVNTTLKDQMEDQTAQKVYSTGVDDVQLTDYQAAGTVRLSAAGQIGPVIEETDIEEQVAGKKFGEIQEELTKIDGVSDVKVEFPYFWVRKVPNDLEKVTIEFTVEDGGDE